ncbi:MAG: hypothetical protein M3P51_12515, partial [Chloroflexota bacterium]|nr:hypothetical protein [Chloroflexota bacterium]
MLASLLPGLRDVRTPLAVGYLWLVFLWIRFADKLPQSRPQGDGVVARLYRLGELGGPPATLAAVSFVAYLLGGLVTLRIDRGVGGLFLGRLRLSEEAARTNHEYQQYLLTRQYLLADLSGRMRVTGRDRSELNELLETAETVRPDDTASLRPRLLVANQEMYGEYDRLAAEASFRINVAIPSFAIGSTVASEHSFWWQLPVI